MKATKIPAPQFSSHNPSLKRGREKEESFSPTKVALKAFPKHPTAKDIASISGRAQRLMSLAETAEGHPNENSSPVKHNKIATNSFSDLSLQLPTKKDRASLLARAEELLKFMIDP